MQLKQTNRIRMFTAVIAVLEQFQSVWSSMAPFAAAFQRFKDKVQAVNAAAQKQETVTAGSSQERENARDALEDVLFLVCEALGVLAHQSSNSELLALTNVSPSGLRQLNDLELANVATEIKAQTVSRVAELATLHVTAENLTELDEAMADFNEAKSAPRAATANRVAQTEALSQLIREASDVLLNELDRMVNLFRRSHPEFVAAYRAARVVVDRTGNRRAKAEPQPSK